MRDYKKAEISLNSIYNIIQFSGKSLKHELPKINSLIDDAIKNKTKESFKKVLDYFTELTSKLEKIKKLSRKLEFNQMKSVSNVVNLNFLNKFLLSLSIDEIKESKKEIKVLMSDINSLLKFEKKTEKRIYNNKIIHSLKKTASAHHLAEDIKISAGKIADLESNRKDIKNLLEKYLTNNISNSKHENLLIMIIKYMKTLENEFLNDKDIILDAEIEEEDLLSKINKLGETLHKISEKDSSFNQMYREYKTQLKLIHSNFHVQSKKDLKSLKRLYHEFRHHLKKGMESLLKEMSFFKRFSIKRAAFIIALIALIGILPHKIHAQEFNRLNEISTLLDSTNIYTIDIDSLCIKLNPVVAEIDSFLNPENYAEINLKEITSKVTILGETLREIEMDLYYSALHDPSYKKLETNIFMLRQRLETISNKLKGLEISKSFESLSPKYKKYNFTEEFSKKLYVSGISPERIEWLIKNGLEKDEKFQDNLLVLIGSPDILYKLESIKDVFRDKNLSQELIKLLRVKKITFAEILNFKINGFDKLHQIRFFIKNNLNLNQLSPFKNKKISVGNAIRFLLWDINSYNKLEGFFSLDCDPSKDQNKYPSYIINIYDLGLNSMDCQNYIINGINNLGAIIDIQKRSGPMYNEVVKYYELENPHRLSNKMIRQLYRNMSKVDRSKKNCVIILSESDYNDAFRDDNYDGFLKNYNVFFFDAESKDVILKHIKKSYLRMGKIDIFVLGGHGSQNSLTLDRRKDNNIDIKDISFFKSISRYSKKGKSIILLLSCLNGEGGKKAKNLANAIRDEARMKVISPTRSVSLEKFIFEINGDFKKPLFRDDNNLNKDIIYIAE